jgi:hypothetical protein
MERLMPDGSMGLVVNPDEDRIRIYDGKGQARFTQQSGAIAMGAHGEFL